MKSKRAVSAVAIAAVAIVALTSFGLTGASATQSTASGVTGRGVDEFGMTQAFFQGRRAPFTYTRGFFCDTTVASSSATGCEVGQTFNKAPGQHDPLFITVPLGFNVPMTMQDCPAGLVCVDHPATIDLTRLESALKPLYPNLTDAALTDALKDAAVPGHDHFITDLNHRQPEWWDVQVIGVKSPTVLKAIRAHRSYKYIQRLIRDKNPNVVGPIPTNLFLFFAAK